MKTSSLYEVGSLVTFAQVGNRIGDTFVVGRTYLEPWRAQNDDVDVQRVLVSAFGRTPDDAMRYFYFRAHEVPVPGTIIVITEHFMERQYIAGMSVSQGIVNTLPSPKKDAVKPEPSVTLVMADGYKVTQVLYPLSTLTTQETTMNGAIYTVAVVRTKTVAQGEGVTTGVQKSEVVHIKQNFPALNDDAAKGIALAEAINKVKDFDVNDPVMPVELRLQKF